jgi:serine O-acetyltransferase
MGESEIRLKSADARALTIKYSTGGTCMPGDHQPPSLEQTLAALQASYAECPNLRHVDQCALPSRTAMVRILDDLRDALFPGFGERETAPEATVALHAGGTLARALENLAEQIARALRHDEKAQCADFEAYRLRGRDIALRFLARLPHVARLLQTDVQAAFDGDPAARSPIECVFCYPGVEAITVQRLAHELHLLGVPLLPRVMTEHAHARTGIDIHPGARIGPSFFIDHGTGVVIGETCELGAHVKLYQGVTLGALSFPKDHAGKIVRGQKRHPTLEDHVVVYANATILGGDTVIGRHSVIGSSVWLRQSVDPHTAVTLRDPELRFRDGRPA